METHIRPGDISRERRSRKDEIRAFSSADTLNLNLRDRFDLERPYSSHGESHHKERNHVRGSPPPLPSRSDSKKQTRRANTADTDELVKHMSNLPSYLEQGVKSQKKAFNVGVLDWRLLEKWQSSKNFPYRSDGSSSSNSNSSSLFSTEDSSTHSGTGLSSLAAHAWRQNPVVKFQIKGIPAEASSSEGKSSCHVSSNQLGSSEEIIVKESQGSTASYPKTAYLGGHDVSSLSKRRTRRSQSMSTYHKSIEQNEKAVHFRPVDDHPIASISKGSKVANGQRHSEEKERSSTQRSTMVHYSELNCDIPRSCPLPCDVNDKKIRVLRPSISQGGRTNDSASAAGSHLHPAGKFISPSKERRSEDNHPVLAAAPTVTELPKESRISKRAVDVAKARYPSPAGQFSFGIGIGTASRKTNSTEDAEALQTSAIAKPGTTREVLSTPLEKSGLDKSVAISKARASPLKRLLDPLLKPREGNNNPSSESLKRESKPVDRAFKTPDRPSTAPGIRVGLNPSSEKSTVILKSHQKGKGNEPAVVQALLQLVVQNGCPLFTFAADSVKDILCAALGKLSTKFEDKYLYTFFSIHELKNKSWINLRGKGSSHEYSPNGVAQMEVSETQLLQDHRSTGNHFMRQFVVSAVDRESGDKTGSEYQLKDELAAIVVSISAETHDKRQTDKSNRTTVILPNGFHTLPSMGKPSPLIDRWRSGGQCDCGGWDSGCKLRILTDSKCQPNSFVKFKLYDQGGADEKLPVVNLAPFKDKEGVLSVSFSSSISPLQAFSICLAVLDTRKHLRSPPPAAHFQEAKPSDGSSEVEAPGSYISVPPHSPVGRV
uniref:Uncharacterized protein n=1 Tax=Kalanchoe fedtschenkoi TaxID=63787 RepID=A0A7N0U3P5_KALFE